MNEGSLKPALVISLDFELHWGVTETVREPSDSYNANLYGARESVYRLLSLFRQRDIHATWATVGMLFASGASELDIFKPSSRPAYCRSSVDTYRVTVGDSEQLDPLHFAPSLIEQIRSAHGQEIATHTFSHYYCDEPGQTLANFRDDLAAAKAIAARDGIDLYSLVFPRNQVSPEYVSVVEKAGLSSYRGNPPGAMYYLPKGGGNRYWVRAIRLADSFLNITGHHTVPWSHIASGEVADVRASHFFRPYSRKLRMLEPLRRRRVKSGLRVAALQREAYHLWWHPHNFGINQKQNFDALNDVLDTFERLRDQFGMQSLTMQEAAEYAHSCVY